MPKFEIKNNEITVEKEVTKIDEFVINALGCSRASPGLGVYDKFYNSVLHYVCYESWSLV